MSEFYDQEADKQEPASHPFHDVTVKGADYRDMGPTGECPCGSEFFYLLATFDPEDRTIGMYFTDGLCMGCGSLVKVPTPADEVPFKEPFDDLDFFEPSPE